MVDLAQKRLCSSLDLPNRHGAQGMYGKHQRNTIVGVEDRRGNGCDWVRAAGAVVRQRVGRGEFHPQLVDDGTQIVGITSPESVPIAWAAWLNAGVIQSTS